MDIDSSPVHSIAGFGLEVVRSETLQVLVAKCSITKARRK